ncbi:MAG: uroporphyrinogen decarboxylase family protein [Bacteroidota bacterium]
MNRRERFLKTINGEVPDRPPIFANFTPQAAKKMSDHLGMPYEEPLDSLLSSRISHTKVLLELGNDAVGIAACAPTNNPTESLGNNILRNEWGMVFKDVGLYNEFWEFPLANAETVEDIENYQFPDPHAEGRFDEAQKAIDTYKKDYGIIADLETAIFETAWYLVGMEKFLMDLMLETPYVEALLDKIMHINTETGKELVRMGADMVWAGDDFGGQDGLLISPDTWRKHFKPRMKYMFEEFRKINPDIKIAWHTCGSVVPLIPEFIEIGMDILNPIQPLAREMEPEFLKSEFGKDIMFFGGICVQDLMPNGTPEEIQNETERRARILGENGGYIIAPAHNIQDDTSVENILAFFEAAKNP